LSGAVVWDCDGVLVDSEPHSVAAWLRVLGSFGIEADPGDVEGCLGLGFRPTYDRLARLPSSRPIPGPESVWPMLMEALGESFGAFIPPFPDALAAVDALAERRILQAVASSSPRSRVDLTLERSGLSGRFTVVVAGDEVPRSKPDPDVYLEAARRLGADPARCVAIEDTGTGARAAAAAGMQVVGVCRVESQWGPLTRASAAVVGSLEPGSLLRLLGSIAG
jgi:beta-phosphoglucomutase-like phosphatase (HAD superfamily)